VALCQARTSTKPLWGLSSSNPYHPSHVPNSCKYILTPILFPFKFKLKGSPAAESDKEVSKIKTIKKNTKNLLRTACTVCLL
jgi:hypothetical protein